MTIIAFQGELGAYSQDAVTQALGDAAALLPCREFFEVGEAVTSGAAELGLLPIENSLAGSVIPSYDVLAAGRLTVLGDVVIPIHHCLLGLPGSRAGDVRRILSHPVALAQCTRVLRSLEAAEAVAVYDTAGAARTVAESGDHALAAIAGRAAAGRYGLEILASDVEDRKDNQTRFVVVGLPGAALPGSVVAPAPSRTMLMLDTENRPGALLRILEPFAANGLNLSKIESRPGTEPWTYRFFLEVDAAPAQPAMGEALEKAGAAGLALEILGSFPRLGRQ